MSLTKLGCLVTALRQSNQRLLASRLPTHGISAGHVTYKNETHTTKKEKEEENDENDQPIKFSSSNAAKWSPDVTGRELNHSDMPPSQPFILAASIAIFLFYFCVLREENDIDKKLTLSMRDRYEDEQKKRLEEERAERRYLPKARIE